MPASRRVRPQAKLVYTSIAYTERIAQLGMEPSIGSIGDAYDCEQNPGRRSVAA
jgi:hypothetical protein